MAFKLVLSQIAYKDRNGAFDARVYRKTINHTSGLNTLLIPHQQVLIPTQSPDG
jgi:hypothetical protein